MTSAETNEGAEVSDAVWRNQLSDTEFGDKRLSFAGKAPKRVVKPAVNLSPRVLKTGEVVLADGTSLGVVFAENATEKDAAEETR